MVRRGRAAVRDGRFGDAEAAYRAALSATPGVGEGASRSEHRPPPAPQAAGGGGGPGRGAGPRPRLVLGPLRAGGGPLRAGEVRDAARAFGDAVRLRPDYARAHLNLGLALERQGRYGEAEAAFRECAPPAAQRPGGARQSRDRPAPSAPRGRRGDRVPGGPRQHGRSRHRPRRARAGAVRAAPVRGGRRPHSARRSSSARGTRAPTCGSAWPSSDRASSSEAVDGVPAGEPPPTDRRPDPRANRGRPQEAEPVRGRRRGPAARGEPGPRPTRRPTTSSASCWSGRGASRTRSRRSARPSGISRTTCRRTSTLATTLRRLGRWTEEAAVYADAIGAATGRPGPARRARARPGQPGRLRPGRRGPAAGRRPAAPRIPSCTTSWASRSAATASTRRPSCRCARPSACSPRSVKARANLALGLGRQGRHAEAEAAYREALTLRPEHPALRRGLGVSLYWQGRYDEAEAAFADAILLKPDYIRVHCDLGRDAGRAAPVRARRRPRTSAPSPWTPRTRRPTRPWRASSSSRGASARRSAIAARLCGTTRPWPARTSPCGRSSSARESTRTWRRRPSACWP